MTENDKTTNLVNEAADVSATADAILSRTLAQNTEQPTQATPEIEQPKRRGRPRKIRDPLILAKLGDKLSTPRKISDDEKIEQGAESIEPSAEVRGGGIPPESTGAGKNFAGEPVGAAPQLPKKNYKKKFDNRPVNHPTTPEESEILLRQRLTSGIRDAKIRQLFELMIQNPDLQMHDAMIAIGYSPQSSAARVIKTKSWQLLVGSLFPDDQLAERERFLLFHKDPRWVNASLDRLHKIKGSFQHTQTTVNVNLDGEVRQLSDQALYDIIEGEIVESDGTSSDTTTD